MQESINQLLEVVVMGLFTIGMAGITYGIQVVVNKIKVQTAKIKNEDQKAIIDNTLDRLKDMVYTGVQATEVSFGKELRQSVKDGKIDKSELLNLKSVVQGEVLAGMDVKMQEVIELGVGDINVYISQLIEVALNDIKNQIK